MDVQHAWPVCKAAASSMLAKAVSLELSYAQLPSQKQVANMQQAGSRLRAGARYTNTTACISRISFIDGAKGILRYRGYPIEQLAEKANFSEVIPGPASGWSCCGSMSAARLHVVP